jgi:hypothetical protein
VQAGYEGQNCEIETNECQSQPCQNGAKCIDGKGNFTSLHFLINITVPELRKEYIYIEPSLGLYCAVNWIRMGWDARTVL